MNTKEFQPFAPWVWLSTQTRHPEVLEYLTEAYETNCISTRGKSLDEVERQVAEYCGCKYAVALASGTAALHLAVKLAGVRPGERVFCSDMTFAATVNPVVYEGGVPVFIDSEYETWNMDPVALERAFQRWPEVKVVVLAHLYGTPAKMDEILAVCQKHGAVLVEDAAESMGATYRGVMTGTFGKVGVCSFNGNKIITGSAGGMLLTDSREDADRARKWSTQSREGAVWYQHEELGYNYRMSNVVASVVRGQLPHLEEHIAQKKAIYERYREGFRGLPVTMNPFDAEKSVPNYWLSCLLLAPEVMCPQERGDLEAGYTPEAGKSCPTEILEVLSRCHAEGRPIWKPMHAQPIYRECDFVSRAEGVDVGMDIFHRGLCLPSDNKMTPEVQDRVIEIVRSCFD